MMTKIRYDAWYAPLSSEVKLQILEDSRKLIYTEHIEKLNNQFGKKISRSSYYRMLTRLEKEKPMLLAEIQSQKALSAQTQGVSDASMPALTEIRAKLGAISKRLDMIDRRQSFMDMQIQSISTGRNDAIVMYMNMRNLNRAIRNSAFVADALEITKDIRYPGRRKVPITQIFNYLDRLDKSTEKRVDRFLREGFSGTFNSKDMTDGELFMLRLRLIWGCSLINQLERDSQVPLSRGEVEEEALFQREVAPLGLFIDFWKDMRQAFLSDVAAQIYHFGEFPTPYESSVAMSKRIMHYQQKQEQ